MDTVPIILKCFSNAKSIPLVAAITTPKFPPVINILLYVMLPVPTSILNLAVTLVHKKMLSFYVALQLV